jgi:large subunit ribosomal protein L17
MADKLVTEGKQGTLAARPPRAPSLLKAGKGRRGAVRGRRPGHEDRAGGYTRVLKLGKRMSDSSEMCLLEWVDFVPKAKVAKAEKAEAAPKAEKKAEKPAKKPAAKKAKKDEEKK